MVASIAPPPLPGLPGLPPRTKSAHLSLPPNSSIRASDLTAAHVTVYDPGFAHTQACRSAITYLNGAAGILRYRGYDIASLASSATFPETTFLLLYGDLPSPAQLAAFDATLVTHLTPPASVFAVINAFPPSSHPMSILSAALSALSAALPALNPSLTHGSLYASPQAREAAIFTACGAFPAIAAAIYRHTNNLPPLPHTPPHTLAHLSYTARFMHLLTGAPPPHPSSAATIARALDALLVLHADHELNCSTAALRQLSSSGVDIFTCLGGAVGALYGPLHGGATEGVLKMLRRIGTAANIPSFLARVKAREEKLLGFGHRVYKSYDPRARIVRSLAYDVFDAVGRVEPLIAVATALEAAALEDDYFVSRKLYPNVDFYTGLIYQAVGFRPEFFPVLFALGRSSGWVSHWAEFLDDDDRRISRPQQMYVGKERREFVPIDERKSADKAPSDDAAAPRRTISRL